ncbi:hypothetical protein OC845_003146 [Tilletia horrida]|nr:hypothetical protein OC845_003146 [Tilletia horrida]
MTLGKTNEGISSRSNESGWSKLSDNEKLGVLLGGLGVVVGVGYGGYRAAMAYKEAVENANLVRLGEAFRAKMEPLENELGSGAPVSSPAPHEEFYPTPPFWQAHASTGSWAGTDEASTSGTKHD